MAEIRARIVLEDTMSSQIVEPIEAVNKLTESAKVANNVIDMMTKKNINIDTTNAINEIKSVTENISSANNVIDLMSKKKVDINVDNTINKINEVKNSVNSTAEVIDMVSGKRIDMDTALANSKIGELKNNIKEVVTHPLNIPINATNKTKEVISKVKGDMASIKSTLLSISAVNKTVGVVSKVKSELLSLAKLPVTIAIKAKDETSTVISKIKDNLFSIKTLAATMATNAVGKATIGAASNLEQEQIAMKHFIGYNNQSSSQADVQKMTDSYISQLRTEANITPFGTSEVIAAGRRAVNITSGDTKAGMDLVKLSENMAALNPGKSVMDAMEALADLKTGETERMKEFGFKISQDDINKAGGVDSYFKQQTGSEGNIGKVFAGGAKELSNSTAGKWSTVTGNLETIGANFGKAFLPVINKILTPLANLLDKNSDKFTKFGQNVIKIGGKIGTALTPAFNSISKIIKSVGEPAFKSLSKIVQTVVLPAFKFLGNIAKEYVIPAISAVAGVIAKYLPPIANSFIKSFNSIKPHLEKFWNTIKVNIIPIVQDLWGKFKEAMPGIQKVVSVAFDVIAKVVGVALDVIGKVAPVIKGIYDFIAPILGWIIDLFNKIASAIKDVYDWFNKLRGKKEETTNTSATDLSKLGVPGLTSAGTLKSSDKSSSNSTDLWKYVTRKNALGTSYFEGGLTYINENGDEIVDLPAGSKIHSNRESNNILKNMQFPNKDITSGMWNHNKSMAPEVAKWGQDIPEGMAKGIRQNTKTVTDATTFMASKIRELIHFTSPDKGPLADFDTYSVDMLKTFGNGIQNNTKLVTNPTTNMATGVKTVYKDLSTQSLTYGQQVVQQLGLGIKSSENNLVAIVHELTQKVINAFTGPDGFDIRSPSRKLFSIGANVIQGFINGLSSKDALAFFQNKISGAISNVGGNVSGWLSAALAITGTPMSWLPGLLQLVKRESGGNPLAYNSISVGGEHATGLMQMLKSTFMENMFPGLSDIANPVANAASAIRYIKKRYGNVMNIPNLFSGNYKGYAVGLTRVPKDNFPALLHEDERVLTANEARNYDKKNNGIQVIIQKLADKLVIREDSDIDKIATAIAKKLTIAEMNI
ncbi:transglycosylase SLT domain-containing protein [Clostridium sp. BJN0013]|uniref:transglycosylase SLT domain-containing protein n=1 Tax=Clostridium sp. BJN0013 TaxID=3236840 RepID=UPI0034C65ECF